MNIAVIFAGGTGKRMNTRALPKQFLEVHGKPVLIYTLEQFQECKDIDGIVLVCVSGWLDHAWKLCEKFGISKMLDIVPGGYTGQESIYHGLLAAQEEVQKAAIAGEDENPSRDIVLIHDGVRPMINEETITACIQTVREKGNAITTAPAIETIFANSKDGCVGQIFNRSQCLMARAPQCFYLADILHAHYKANMEKRNDFIDSAMMMQHYGAILHTVPGPVENIKITTPTDFYLFRALLDAQESMQIVGL